MDCVRHITDPPNNESDLESCINIFVKRLHTESLYNELDIFTANTIRSASNNIAPPIIGDGLSDYEIIGGEIIDNILTAVNRLVSYCYSVKGQYDLSEISTQGRSTLNYFLQFDAKASLDNGPKFDFRPRNSYELIVAFPAESSYITKEDWGSIETFVADNTRTSLIDELLSRTEELFSKGLRRSAILEAVSAMELAISSFVNAPNLEHETLNAGIRGIKDLKKTQKELGLNKTIKILLPILFNESHLGDDIISGCIKAYEDRNNVAHNGMRDISEVALRAHIDNITNLCSLLIMATLS